MEVETTSGFDIEAPLASEIISPGGMIRNEEPM